MVEKKIERMENIVYINLKLCPYYIKQNVTFFLLKNSAWTLFFFFFFFVKHKPNDPKKKTKQKQKTKQTKNETKNKTIENRRNSPKNVKEE